jgi:hypothetical protein
MYAASAKRRNKAPDGLLTGLPTFTDFAENARLGIKAEVKMEISDAEKLGLLMLCDIYDNTAGNQREFDTKFIRDAIYGGHTWAFDWKMPGVFHGHVDKDANVKEVVDILEMWSHIEFSHGELEESDRERVTSEAAPFGANPKFSGFDGNNESEHMGIADMLVNTMGRWSQFAGREMNSHMPTLDSARRMLARFRPIRTELGGDPMEADDLIAVLRERIHPEHR